MRSATHPKESEPEVKEGNMTYSNAERVHILVKPGLEIPMENQQSMASGQPGELRQRKERSERGLDNTLSETFPCSDPLSSIPNPTTC